MARGFNIAIERHRLERITLLNTTPPTTPLYGFALGVAGRCIPSCTPSCGPGLPATYPQE
eukprot:9400734-Pyramimonas_sp.AAC.2